MKKLVIFGATTFARVAQVYFAKDSRYEVAAFTVHDAYRREKALHGLDVVPFERLEETHPPGDFDLFVAIGYKRVNKARAEVYRLCKDNGYELVTYVSSRTSCWDETRVGDNCFIFEHNAIMPFATIGNDVIIGTGNQIGHDVTLGDHCYIAAQAVICGNVTIGPYAFIGANATLGDGVTVGAESIIGAGAVILKDTEPGSVHVARHTDAAPLSSSLLSPLFK